MYIVLVVISWSMRWTVLTGADLMVDHMTLLINITSIITIVTSVYVYSDLMSCQFVRMM